MPSFSSLSLNHSLRNSVVLLAVALVAAGCATHRPAPVEDRTLGRTEVPRGGAASSTPSGVATEGGAAQTYTVKRGDTLHQIALDTGLDYRDLAAWNNVENVNRIYPGQVLRLTAPGTAPNVATAPNQGQETTTPGVTTAPLRSPPPPIAESRPKPGTSPQSQPPVVAAAEPATPTPAPLPPGAISTLKTSPKAIKEPYSDQAVRELDLAASAAPAPPEAVAPPPPSSAPPKDSPTTAQPRTPSSAPSTASGSPSASSNPSLNGSQSPGDADALDWSWPAKGKIISGFSETANLKGIDIAGTAGEPVRASAAGRVVYAGSGLRGYGKLIIIKHNATYLSAYAHNRDILVKEGQQVTRGQKIAEMGSTDADRVMLHFEIRRHGKPMDPTKFLPPAS